MEEALCSHPSVAAVAAFSAPHAELQEVVGVLVQARGGGGARPRLRALQEHALAGGLHPSKWPQLVVYMDAGLPTTAALKLMRAGMAERLALPELSDATPAADRVFEADTPPPGAPISQPIACRRAGEPAEAAGADALPPSDAPLCLLVRRTMAAVLMSCETEMLGGDDDFFAAGGSSLAAGRLAGLLRAALPGVPLQVGLVYTAPTAREMAAALLRAGASPGGGAGVEAAPAEAACDVDARGDVGCAVQPWSPTSPLALLVQAMPIAVLQPARRITAWLFFALVLASNVVVSPVQTSVENNHHHRWWRRHHHHHGSHPPPFPVMPPPSPPGPRSHAHAHLSALVVSLVATCDVLQALLLTSLATHLVLPWVGIACKWLLVGRFRDTRGEPRPLWGLLYLRWWLVRQICELCGRGFFAWHGRALVWYYRLMGASIGRDVTIHWRANLGEYDLLTIEDGAWVSAKTTVRPFGLVSGGFVLSPIRLGAFSTVGQQSIVAPGTRLPSSSCIPACSSSAEARANVEPAEAREHCRDNAPPPHPLLVLFLGGPLLLLVHAAARVPQAAVLLGMTHATSFTLRDRSFAEVVAWFATPARYPWYVLNHAARDVVVPFVQFAASLLVKRLLLRPPPAGPRQHGLWEAFRLWMLDALFGHGLATRVCALLGANFEGASCVLRLLGARVGKGVFNSGSGLDTVDWDYISIGDHAVFGSRSSVAATGAFEIAPISIGDGAMLADRCCVQPGGSLGRNAVLGSGGVLPAGSALLDGSVWIGSKEGRPVLWSAARKGALPEATETPFSRAFGRRGANEPPLPYARLPVFFHFCFNMFVESAIAAYWCIPLVGSLAAIKPTRAAAAPIFTFAAVYCTLHAGTCVGALALDTAAKWALIGRRKPGRYLWDDSSYCQRWVLHKRIQKVRERICRHICGSQYLVWYLRANGASIGASRRIAASVLLTSHVQQVTTCAFTPTLLTPS